MKYPGNYRTAPTTQGLVYYISKANYNMLIKPENTKKGSLNLTECRPAQLVSSNISFVTCSN